MLAPDDLDPILGAVNGFHANILAADSISTILRSFTIYSAHTEADWITDLRGRMPKMANTGQLWLKSKPEISTSILPAFENYYKRFTTVAAHLPRASNGTEAAIMMDRLTRQIMANLEDVTNAKNTFTDWVNSAKAHTSYLDESITSAWRTIGSSEKKIVNLSEEIIKFQYEISQLEGTLSLASISNGTVSSAKSILTSIASIIYAVAVDGLSLPFLSVGATFFTFGKMFYDIFSSSAKIQANLKKLGSYRLDLNYEQTSLAQTKAVLMYIYDIRLMLEQQNQTLRELEAFWQSELRNVETVRHNFLISSDYNKDNSEIIQLPIAQSVWFTLGNHCESIRESFNRATNYECEIKIAL